MTFIPKFCANCGGPIRRGRWSAKAPSKFCVKCIESVGVWM